MPKLFVMSPPFLHSRRWIFGLRSAGACKNSNADHDNRANPDPKRRGADEEGADGQPYDKNDEPDQVDTER